MTSEDFPYVDTVDVGSPLGTIRTTVQRMLQALGTYNAESACLSARKALEGDE